MTELLPCPFCGGEAETLTAESMHGGYLFGIMCNDCRSRGDVYGTEAEAITAWNTRAERMCRAVPYDDAPYLVCSECGAVQPEDFTAYYCWSCGAKITPKCSETTPKVVEQ